MVGSLIAADCASNRILKFSTFSSFDDVTKLWDLVANFFDHAPVNCKHISYIRYIAVYFKTTRASTLNDSTRKTVFKRKMAIQVLSVSMSMKTEKPLEEYILRHNNFGLIYEMLKDIMTARSKNDNFRRHHSHLMPPTPTNIRITLIRTN